MYNTLLTSCILLALSFFRYGCLKTCHRRSFCERVFLYFVRTLMRLCPASFVEHKKNRHRGPSPNPICQAIASAEFVKCAWERCNMPLAWLLSERRVSSHPSQSIAAPFPKPSLWQHHSWSCSCYEMRLWSTDRCTTCDMLMYAAAFIRLSRASSLDLSENWMLLSMKNRHVQRCSSTWQHWWQKWNNSQMVLSFSYAVNTAASPGFFHVSLVLLQQRHRSK